MKSAGRCWSRSSNIFAPGNYQPAETLRNFNSPAEPDSKMNKNRCLLAIILSLCVTSLSADNPSALREYVRSDFALVSGTVTIATVQGHTYLIAVGTSEVKGSKPEALVQARQVAQFDAEDKLAKFIYGSRVSSLEQFTSSISIKTVSEDPKPILHQKDEWFEIIKVHGEGLLRGIQVVTTWKSSDGRHCFHASALTLR